MFHKSIHLFLAIFATFSLVLSSPHALPEFNNLQNLARRQNGGGGNSVPFAGFYPGEFVAPASTDEPFLTVDGEFFYVFSPNDTSLGVFDGNGKVLASAQLCQADCTTSTCLLAFDSTGDLVVVVGQTPQCDVSSSGGKGFELGFLGGSPYVAVVDKQGNPLWTLTK
jgi:hypothetical protein